MTLSAPWGRERAGLMTQLRGQKASVRSAQRTAGPGALSTLGVQESSPGACTQLPCGLQTCSTWITTCEALDTSSPHPRACCLVCLIQVSAQTPPPPGGFPGPQPEVAPVTVFHMVWKLHFFKIFIYLAGSLVVACMCDLVP